MLVDEVVLDVVVVKSSLEDEKLELDEVVTVAQDEQSKAANAVKINKFFFIVSILTN